MQSKYKLLLLFLLAVFCAPVFAQTHVSVPLDNQVYYILEQAQLRGLCATLPGIRPYTQSVVVSAIMEILGSENIERLNSTEHAILVQYLFKFSLPQTTGMDWNRGAWYGEANPGNLRLSANIGASANFEGSTGLYFYTEDQNKHFGTEIWLGAYLNGDISRYVSYGLDFAGGLIYAPRKYLGKYNTYYDSFTDTKPNENGINEFQNYEFDVYSEPLTHFPYSYRKQWDGSIFLFDDLSAFDFWPETFAGGYGILSEITASFFENKLFIRAGRLTHEWGFTPLGSSLSFNMAARPFFGVETQFSPFSWFSIASLTGSLEYYNREGIKTSSMSFQNLFSITMLQFNYKNILFFDITDAVVYPKRIELGYMSPITSSFFYQNNVGDFDNLAMSFNLKAQIPNFGNIWFSFFLDEMTLLSDLFELDRQMMAVQAGTVIYLPFLSFSSLKISYTVVNPYNYTHNRNFNPWYGENRMETAYVNNGVSIGYYLPPNSDELLIKFETMPIRNLNANLQYQLIRHGADFGDSYVDGSNLLSELDPDGRDDNVVLKRFFLQDGAYQWFHVIKFGGEWTLDILPISFYWEIGAVFSYFTDIETGKNNSGQPYPYSLVDRDPYLRYNAFIAKIGIKLFPR